MHKTANILLVEDNPGDIALCEEAFEETKFLNKISIARDGQEALDFLNQTNGFEKEERPDMILLDMNLPKRDGIEVLNIIKTDEELKTIPVVMLTSSQNSDDILNAYEQHANCYIVKPIDAMKFIEVVQKIENFWVSVVCLSEKKADVLM